MNKTININLAGLFFHIDEDAYNRLQRYLAAVRNSFSETTGADEIMSDIESRIAELFLEKRANEQQVISIVHVESVIDIMGQPEDYEVDEDIFTEAGPRTRRTNFAAKGKQLFRDTQNGYVGGVSAGLSYYLGMDTIWIRVLWIVATFFSAGWLIPIYILLWIFVPDAVTTNQRLTMMGKEVNITNIEDNFKAGFEPVADGQTDAGHRIVGQKGKRGTVRFFGFLGRFMAGIFKAIVKIFGLILFLATTIAIVALIVSTITASAVDIDGYSLWTLFDWVVPAEYASFWLVLAIILAAGIPLFLLAVLGLKLLVSNLRTLGSKVYLALAAIWIVAIIALSIMIGKIAASQAVDASVQKTEKFAINSSQPFSLNLDRAERARTFNRNGNNFEFAEMDGQEIVKYYDVKVATGSTTDSVARVELFFKSKGASFEEAKERAKLIQFDYKLTDSSFVAADYFYMPKNGGFGDHDVEIMIYLPEGTTAKFNERFGERYRSYINRDAFSLGNNIEYTYQIKDGKAVCLDCPIIEEKMEALDNSTETDSISNDSIVIPENDGNWQYDGNDGVEQNNLP
ncbi:phage shock protein C (PspC) family protein [Nonlabens sp. Hel1_33_55]|uniref:PspC domain-containing protein n=1 Tax=Nonlabens sp. Hel1_33_55 TaxID=1336802 RepID=UPI000875D744|nr:PspC domain-containing protein [Nonlabens sp. Hel1_33_55]SCY13967.1 phage shock protein C (PspC) family protein [Nonlabens sp. Hel1_33_55]